MELKLRLNEEQENAFKEARSIMCNIVHREMSANEFGVFALMWFINGFLREDVGDEVEDGLEGDL